MKRIIIILVFLVCGISSAQQYFFNGTVYVPKTTVQINAITAPVNGRVEANSDTGSLWYFDGTIWKDTFVGSAEDVSITDTGGYFTGTDVEAALQELGAGTAGGAFGIVASGSTDVTNLTSFPVSGGSNTATVTITHSLGYSPSVDRIFIQLSRPDQQSVYSSTGAIGNITSTTFDVLMSATSGHDLQLNWAIFGTGSTTPLDFGEIVTGIDTELGSTDWQGVALGETSITAYRGDRGKTAYDHTSLSNNPHSVTKSQVGLSNVDNTSDMSKPISTLTQTALNAKANLSGANFTGPIEVPTATSPQEAVNLGQLMDSLATVEVSNPIIWNESTSETIGPDQNNNIFISDSTETVDKVFIIQNQSNGGYTEDVGYTFITQGEGKIFIKGETGAGVDPVEVSTVRKAYALIRKGANTWIPFGTSEPWDPYGPELYDNSNAFAALNNSNSTTGLDAISGTTQSSVANTSPSPGSYAWEIVSTTVGVTSRGREVLTVDDAPGTYKVEFWARQSVGSGSGGARFRMQSTTDDSFTAIPDSWTYYEFDITATSINPQIEFFTNRSAAALAVGSIGDAIQVTGFSIKEKL